MMCSTGLFDAYAGCNSVSPLPIIIIIILLAPCCPVDNVSIDEHLIQSPGGLEVIFVTQKASLCSYLSTFNIQISVLSLP